jgi:hypothetical protein
MTVFQAIPCKLQHGVLVFICFMDHSISMDHSGTVLHLCSCSMDKKLDNHPQNNRYQSMKTHNQIRTLNQNYMPVILNFFVP